MAKKAPVKKTRGQPAENAKPTASQLLKLSQMAVAKQKNDLTESVIKEIHELLKARGCTMEIVLGIQDETGRLVTGKLATVLKVTVLE